MYQARSPTRRHTHAPRHFTHVGRCAMGRMGTAEFVRSEHITHYSISPATRSRGRGHMVHGAAGRAGPLHAWIAYVCPHHSCTCARGRCARVSVCVGHMQPRLSVTVSRTVAASAYVHLRLPCDATVMRWRTTRAVVHGHCTEPSGPCCLLSPVPVRRARASIIPALERRFHFVCWPANICRAYM